MIPFSFRQLEYFIAAAEQGSISAAARARHVSQPSVSQAIAQLEQALGEALFHRRISRGLELTPAGQRLLGRARDILGAGSGLARAPARPRCRASWPSPASRTSGRTTCRACWPASGSATRRWR